MTINIRDQVVNKGFSGIDGMQKDIASAIEKTDGADQVGLMKLQQQIASYTNTISLMSSILNTMAETDKEIIRNT